MCTGALAPIPPGEELAALEAHFAAGAIHVVTATSVEIAANLLARGDAGVARRFRARALGRAGSPRRTRPARAGLSAPLLQATSAEDQDLVDAARPLALERIGRIVEGIEQTAASRVRRAGRTRGAPPRSLPAVRWHTPRDVRVCGKSSSTASCTQPRRPDQPGAASERTGIQRKLTARRAMSSSAACAYRSHSAAHAPVKDHLAVQAVLDHVAQDALQGCETGTAAEQQHRWIAAGWRLGRSIHEMPEGSLHREQRAAHRLAEQGLREFAAR